MSIPAKPTPVRWLMFSCVCAVLCCAHGAAAPAITAIGNWSLTIDSGDLVGGAGTDLIETYESGADETLIAISNMAGNEDNWRVDVRRTDTSWHGDLRLWVRRTGDGSGAGSITGGTSYQEVSSTDGAFFSGAGDRSGIPIQLQLTGVSLQVPPESYSTRLSRI